MLNRSRSLLVSALFVSACAVVACGGDASDSSFKDGTNPNDPSGAGGGEFNAAAATGANANGLGTASECSKMDIVFVVDNSGSMKQEQDNLATNFPKFVNVISSHKTKAGAPLDYRVAVTSTDLTQKGLRGGFATTRGEGAPRDCSPGPSRPWLVRDDGNVGGFFTCRAQLGTNGDGIEYTIESFRLALTDRVADGKNEFNGESFRRNDALLAAVLITDEDEGGSEAQDSGKPGGVQPKRADMLSYIPDFDKIAGGKGRWAAAAIAGPGPGRCSSPTLGDAEEAVRLKTFIGGLGSNGVVASICSGDLSIGLQKALDTFSAACQNFPPSSVN